MRIYLASPYYHPDFDVRHERFVKVCRAAAMLIMHKYIVFSPIAHSHPINVYSGLDCDSTVNLYGLWMMQDLPLLKWADEMWILTLDGWKESKGIGIERRYARKLGKFIRLIEPKTMQLSILLDNDTT